MRRFPFLDWMRGLAVLVMIQCHTFNSLTRLDLRDRGAYTFTQFVGGMAAPLFLFMAGMTMGFQMESLERHEPDSFQCWIKSLLRSVYILGIAFAFRFTNWIFSMPHADPGELTRVDILNCMGVGMAVLAAAAVFRGANRVRFAVLAGATIIALSPLIANLDWHGAPALLREYIVPGPGRGRFPFFPWTGYLAFGVALGGIVRRVQVERLDRLMQWSTLAGVILSLGAWYLANLPYSIYPKSDFWLNSPALVVIRVGIMLAIMAGAYVWTEYSAGSGWSWMQALGKNSLMVYWIHVMLVYGAVARPLKRALSIQQAALAALAIILLMVGLSAAWLWWKERKPAGKNLPQPSPAGRRARA